MTAPARAADPAPPPAQRPAIDALVAELGDPDYEVRQRAQAELARLGFAAFDALAAARDHEDLEIASRAKYLLRLMQVHLIDKDDPPEVVECLRNFRLVPLGEQLARMARLAKLPEDKGIAALCRLTRFEDSEILSKHAAVAIIAAHSPRNPPSEALAKRLRLDLATCRREAAGWLRVLAQFHDAPREAMAAWTALTDKEQAALARGDPQTDPRIVAALADQQLHWACKLAAADPAAVARAIRAVLAPRVDLAAMLSPHVDWIVQRRLWEALKTDPADFAQRLLRNPWATLYAAAQAYELAGETALAEATATRALAMDLADVKTRAIVHFQMAFALQREGLFRWAEREYRRVMDLAVTSNPLRNEAYYYLAQMLHDQADELRAAKVMAELVEALKKEGAAATAARTLAEAAAQRDYLYACHFAGGKDPAKHRRYLEEALAADPTNVEVLIACYHLPDQTPEFHKQIVQRIDQVVQLTRQEIERMPTQASPCNQLAWLVANTEGDLDEALRASRRSIEIQPQSAGCLDTLARCYFAKGDYAAAVKTQIEAAQLDPHSGQIVKQLALFRKKYQEKFGKPAPEPNPKKMPAPGANLIPSEPDESSGASGWDEFGFGDPFEQ
ncbi:MAG: hypothetical protein JW809_12340 [Pirellulales bacterium]|nr:hypothetical protein [Pirellulales bacterium]